MKLKLNTNKNVNLKVHFIVRLYTCVYCLRIIYIYNYIHLFIMIYTNDKKTQWLAAKS